MAKLLLFASLAALLVGSSLAAPDFCSAVVENLNACPAVDAVANVDLAKYAGTWYLVGTNAQFAFSQFGGRGGQCATATYGALQPAGGRNRVSVTNRALLTTSATRETRSREISGQAAATARGVRSLCFRLVPGGTAPLTSVLGLVNSIRSTTVSSTSLSAAAKTKITAQVTNIRAAVDKMSARAADIFGALETVQSENLVLTGATLPTTYVLKSTVNKIKAQGERVQKLEDALVSQREAIRTAAQAITAIVGFQSAAILASARAIEALTLPGASPIASTLMTMNGGGAGIVFAANRVGSQGKFAAVITSNGTATQDPVTDGALSVSFVPGISAPYNIIKLEGSAASGYSTAIVWGCTPDINNVLAPYNYFYILSRDPRPSQASINNALSFLQSKGIFFGGDNDFLKVSQNIQLCKPVSAANKKARANALPTKKK